MTDEDDIAALQAKRICYECIGEAYLKAQVETNGAMGQCSYCDRTANCYTMLEMADRVEMAFEQHYRHTTSCSDDGPGGEPVIEAIANAAVIEEEPSNDIQLILDDRYEDHEAAKIGEETEFSPDSHYEEKDVTDHELRGEWRYFEQSLKTESRFFTSSTHLKQIFNGIDKLSSHDGRPLVISAGPGTSIAEVYRARVYQATDKLKVALCYPDQELGSPPMIAAGAGRMNARGISVFYGADDPAAAISEVRPPVGSRVAVARFHIIRPLRVLDLTALSEAWETGSLFDTVFADRLERAVFLQTLSRRMTRPVMPDDEAFEYLATQAIADFLATTNDPVLDGIVFPSVQAGKALNIVLFHKASRVEPLDRPDGIEIKAYTGFSTEDGWDDDYHVSEEVPPPPPAKPKRQRDLASFAAGLATGAWLREPYDARSATLRVDLTSISVHPIKHVDFDYDTHAVRRHRSEKKPALKPPPTAEDWDELF